MDADFGPAGLRQKIDVIELLALFGTGFGEATEKQLLSAKLFVQGLRLAGLDVGAVKLLLFNMAEKLPEYSELDVEQLAQLMLPETELDGGPLQETGLF